jgi:AP-1 complex subunit mu
VQLFSHYFKKVKEKRIRENFVLIYELLDEVCDYGIPQITDPFALKSYIFQKGAFQHGAIRLHIVAVSKRKYPD